MAVTPGPPPFDPNKKPILQGANDTDPYVGKPKPMPATRPVYGSSDGSGFDFQAYLAGKHRPRPVQVLPGQGMGPMPVGTKPLPNPVVKDPRTGGVGLEDWIKSHPNGPIYDEWPGSWNRGPVLSTGDNRLNRGDMGMVRPGFDGRVIDPGFDIDGGMQDMKGGLNQGGQSVAFGMGMPTQYGGPRDNNAGRLSRQAIAGGLMDDRGYPGAQLGGTQVQMKPGGMGAGGVDPSTGVWTPPSDEYMRGLESGQIAPKWAGAPGSKEYEGWLNSDQRKARLEKSGLFDGRGIVNDTYDTSGQGAINRTPGGPPPVGTGPGSMGKPQQPGGMPSREGGARHRGRRPPQAPVNPQALQQGAEALYGDNTIPHEFKGQLLQAAQSGDAQAFNEMLFNSGIPHETKLRLQQLFGYGSGAPTQAATPDQGVQQAGPPGGFDPRMGSGYYGAF